MSVFQDVAGCGVAEKEASMKRGTMNYDELCDCLEEMPESYRLGSVRPTDSWVLKLLDESWTAIHALRTENERLRTKLSTIADLADDE